MKTPSPCLAPEPLGPECPPTQRLHIISVHITHSFSKTSPLAGTQEHRVTLEGPPRLAGLTSIVVIGSRRDRHKRRSWRLDERHCGLGGWNHNHPIQRPTSDLYSSYAKKTKQNKTPERHKKQKDPFTSLLLFSSPSKYMAYTPGLYDS